MANEVKSLANQTAKATEYISGQVAAIQAATQSAVDAILSIGRTIGRISGIAETVSGSIARQTSSTERIITHVREVQENTGVVNERFVDVTQASASSYGSAIAVIWAAQDLSRPTQSLNRELDASLTTLRQG